MRSPVADTPARTFTQARIRVSEEGAAETRDALTVYETHLLELRRMAVDEGLNEAVPVLNRKIASVRRVFEETIRTIEEAGW
jgi:hypothetical protein